MSAFMMSLDNGMLVQHASLGLGKVIASMSRLPPGAPNVSPAPGLPRRMTSPTNTRKQSLYFPEEMLREIQEEATRQDRSLSWIMQRAWRAARERIAKLPGTDELGPPAGSP